MNRKNTILIALAFVIATACSPYRNDPDLKRARDFLDAYYVMANHKESLQMSQGSAAEQIQKEVELLKGVEANSEVNAYKSRDVVFNLQRQEKTDDEATYLYDLKIIMPDGMEIKKQVNIIVDRKSNKVKHFGMI